jgi:hypothetical protein
VPEEVVNETSPLISPSRGGVRPRGALLLPTAPRWDRVRVWLGQGEWNEQEHCCVYIASNVSFGFAFATDVCIVPLIARKHDTDLPIGHC